MEEVEMFGVSFRDVNCRLGYPLTVWKADVLERFSYDLEKRFR